MDGGDDIAEPAESMAEQMPADLFPHLTEFAADHVTQPNPATTTATNSNSVSTLILDGLTTAAEAES